MLRGLFKPKSNEGFFSTQSSKKLKWIKRGLCLSALILAVGVPVGLQAATKYKVTKIDVSNTTDYINVFNEVHATSIKKVDGKYAYCVNMGKETPKYVNFSEYATEDTSSSKVKNVDKVWKCLKYGYPNHTYWKTGHTQKTREVNYYATQLAVWSYTETKFNSNSKIDKLTFYSGKNSIGAGKSWRMTSSDAKKVKEIAKKIRAQVEADKASMKPSLSVSPSSTTSYYSNYSKRYQSKKITVKGNNIKGEVSIELSGTDADKCYVVDADTNEKITKIEVGKTFRIIFPDGVDSTNITYKVSGSGKVESGLVYTTDKPSTEQNIIQYKAITRTAKASDKGTVAFAPDTGTLKIKKVDEKGNVLAGAEFTVKGKDVDYEKTGLKSGEDGTIVEDGLLPGTYEVTETNPPNGYDLPDNPTQEVTIKTGETGEVEFVNTKSDELAILISKVDQDGNSIPGVKFKIWNEDKSFETEVTTNDRGNASINVKELGKYFIQEISAPNGYKVDSTIHEHTFTTDKPYAEIKIVNEKITGALKIIKYDQETDENIAGAVFSVSCVANDYEEEVTVGEDGTATLTDLSPGTYLISEVTAPSGYELSDKEYTAVIDENSTADVPIEVKVPNTKMPSGMELTKTDVSTGEPLEGAHFKIYKEDKTTVVAEGETSSTGKATFTLEEGTYYYQETDAPSGYKIDDSLYKFVVEAGKITKCQMTNELKDTGIEITKVDISTGEELPGATFAIYAEDGKTVIEKGVTDSNGIAYFKLDYGKYYYQEINAPSGYQVDNSKFPFEIKEGNEIVKCKMTNKPIIPKTGITDINKYATICSIGTVILVGGILLIRKRLN